MALGGEEHALVGEERLGGELAEAADERHEAEIGLTVADHAQDLGEATAPQLETRVGVRLAVRDDAVHEHVSRHLRGGCDDEAALPREGRGLDGQRVDLAEQRPGKLRQMGAGRGELHGPLAAVEEGHARLALELLDVEGHGRLTDHELVRGLGDAAELDYGAEAPEFPQVHVIPPMNGDTNRHLPPDWRIV